MPSKILIFTYLLPSYSTATNDLWIPKIRRRPAPPCVNCWSNKSRWKNPAAIVLNGDVPNDGRLKEDYAVYQRETKIWRDENLLVIPALGNHELIGDEKPCLENWWNAFPHLRKRRWYSTQLGSHVYIIALDSTSSLTPGSDQAKWLARQIDGMSGTIDFLVITLHHPPVPTSRPISWSITTRVRTKSPYATT